MGCEGGTSKYFHAFGRYFRRLMGKDVCGVGNATSGLFIVITSDVMGKDEDLGRELMKGFFETIKSTGELPDVIFLMNAGVRLTTTDEELVPLLKGIQDAGVEVYSCGMCLKHYGLEDALRVGHRGSTGQVIEGIKDARVVWI